MLLQSFGFQLVYILFRSKALFRSLCGKLLSLHIAKFLWGHSSLCGFGCEVLLQLSNLLGGWLAGGRHCVSDSFIMGRKGKRWVEKAITSVLVVEIVVFLWKNTSEVNK